MAIVEAMCYTVGVKHKALRPESARQRLWKNFGKCERDFEGF